MPPTLKSERTFQSGRRSRAPHLHNPVCLLFLAAASDRERGRRQNGSASTGKPI